MSSPGPSLTHLALLGLALLTAGGFVATVSVAGRVGSRRSARAAKWARRGDLTDLRVRRPIPGRITLGRHQGRLLAAEERASVLVVGPTQSGKTTGLVVPAMREWAGPVLATSVKTDLLQQTLAGRAELGEARVFDPTQSSGLSHAVWSPLAASTTWAGARRTATALLGVGDQRTSHTADDAFWRPAGARYLAALLHAATKAPDLTMADVLHWIATSEFTEPGNLLSVDDRPGVPAPALDSVSSVRDADPRFTSSLLQTIATALDAWQEPQVAGAMMGDSRISADWLLSGAHTLYLVAPATDQRRLGGLFAALVAHIVAGATR
jgi:type IV secretion system protein VirD4